MKLSHTLLALIVALVLTGCSKTIALRNYDNNQFPVTNQEMTLATAQNAIQRGALALGWTTQVVNENQIEATLNIRKHQLIVLIDYNEKDFSIKYKSSINLAEGKGKIHRQYANWSMNLIKQINSAALMN